VLNCSAVVETLFESELFGHVRGALTGAAQDKMGLFEYADKGTIFSMKSATCPLPHRQSYCDSPKSESASRRMPDAAKS
jgi:transcriptional regulator of acetoin/glycerol metabolism